MKNLGQLMKQAQEMQSKMSSVQEQLADAEVHGEAGAGLVAVTLNGKGEMRRVTIDPTLMTDREVLEDLIVAAHADAKSKSEAMAQEKMKDLTGGLALPPGLKLPF